jgi:hypothetical protein
VLVSFRSYRFDSIDGEEPAQEGPLITAYFHTDSHMDNAAPLPPLRPYPFIHSPLLLSVWTARAAVAWGRAAPSLQNIHGTARA